ncbi:MAG: hypothetical protein RR301_11750, partial [Clostridia bacterium]
MLSMVDTPYLLALGSGARGMQQMPPMCKKRADTLSSMVFQLCISCAFFVVGRLPISVLKHI